MKNKFVLTLVWLLTTAAALGQNLIPLPNRCLLYTSRLIGVPSKKQSDGYR